MTGDRVVMLFRYIPQYRLPFLHALHDACIRKGIEFTVIYGDPADEDAARADRVEFWPGVFVRNRFIKLGRWSMIWQPVLSRTRNADLVIVEQQVKLLVNYVLLLRQLRGVQKVAFFGHGKNLQARSDKTPAERLKKRMVRLPHWWLVYTQGVARYVTELGYPAERITVFDNAIDTKHLMQLRSEITDAELSQTRQPLNLPSENVCIYVGSMYPEKRIGFLLQACERIKRRVPDFSMLFIGAGSDEHLVTRFCDEHRWATHLGPCFDREKVKYCMLARLLLLPGAVGLSILDAFAMGIPVVTTDVPFHGPEIEYLTNGTNGVIVAPAGDVERYAAEVAALLLDRARLTKFAKNCVESAAQLSIENMTERFFCGIERALATA